MERCVSSGKKANVELWNQDNGTRSHAVNGDARCRPSGELVHDLCIDTLKVARKAISL